MSIQEIANFLVEWEYNEDSYLDITYAALSLFKQDKDCLYAYANSYGPFITHLLEVYEKRQEYSPDKYLIHAGNARVALADPVENQCSRSTIQIICLIKS